MIRIKTTMHGSLTPFERELVMPGLEIGRFLAARIASRRERGQGPRGPAPGYKAVDGRIWVRPGAKQPNAAKYQITHGPLRGWAVYPDLATLRRLRGEGNKTPGKPKTYHSTDELFDRLKVKADSPKRTSVRFRGTHRGSGKRAERLARDLDDPQGLLRPAREELREAEFVMRQLVSADLLGALGVAEASFRARAKARSLTRRVGKLRSRAVSASVSGLRDLGAILEVE